MARSGTYVLKPQNRSRAQRQQVREDQRHREAVGRRNAMLHRRAMARRDAARSRLTPQRFASQKPSKTIKVRPGRTKGVSSVLTNTTPIYKAKNYASTPKLRYYPRVRGLKDAYTIQYEQAKAMGIDQNHLRTRKGQDMLAKALKSEDANQRAAARQLRNIVAAIDKYEAKRAPQVAADRAKRQFAVAGETKRRIRLSLPAGAIAEKVLGERGALQKATNWVYENLPTELMVEAGTATGPKFGPGGGRIPAAKVNVNSKFAGNAAKDAITLPMTTATSTYLLAKAGLGAASGDSAPIKRMWSEFKDTDPVALLVQGRVKESGRAAYERPVTTALELSGGKAAVGRTAGAVARRGTPAMRRVGRTARDPEHLYGDHYRQRRYSPDLITKGFQVLGDRRAAKSGARVRLRGTEDAYRKSEVNKVVDEVVATGEAIRRQDRQQIIESKMPTPVLGRIKGKARNLSRTDRGILVLAADRTLRSAKTAVADLKSYRDELAIETERLAKAKNPNEAKIRDNAKMIDRIDKALEKGVDANKLFEVADEYRKSYEATEASLVEEGLIEPSTAAMAKEIPYAVRHMGAREVDAGAEWLAKNQELSKAVADTATEYERQVRRSSKTESKIAQELSGRDRQNLEGLLREIMRDPRVEKAAKSRAEAIDAANRAKVAASEVRARFGEDSPVAQAAVARASEMVRAKLEADHVFRREAGIAWKKISPRIALESSTARPAGYWRSVTRMNDLMAKSRKLAEDVDLAKADHENARKTHAEHQANKRSGMELRDRDGNRLDAVAIRRHRESHGVSDPAFVSQRPGQTMRNAAYVNKHPNRGKLPGEHRTGEATRQGTFDSSYEAAWQHAIRATGLRDWVQQFDRILKNFAIKTNGRPLRFKSAADARKFLKTREGRALLESQQLPELVPVRVSPIGSKSTTVDKIIDTITDSSTDLSKQEAAGSVIQEFLREATDGDKGPVVLVPRHVWERLNQHYERAGVGRKTLQSINSQFKSVVLPTSTKWIAGNIIDNAVRLAVSGAGPRDYFLAKRFLNDLKKMDPKRAEEFRAMTMGGMHFSTRGRMGVLRTADDFNNFYAQQAHILGQTKPAKIAVAPWRVYRDTVFDLNSRLEHVFEQMALGRSIRSELRSATGSWNAGLKVQPKAVEDLANGLRNTSAQIQLAREVRRIVGNWTTYGPTARFMLFDALPFGAWMKNALQFVFVTMPANHPILTGLIAAGETMTREDRIKLGLEPFVKGAKPDFMQGAIPVRGGQIGMQNMTSFGFAGAFPESIGTMPWAPFRNALDAARGLDWKGDHLKNKDGSELDQTQRAALAFYLFGEALIPLIAVARRIREQGGKQQGASYVWKVSVKPGSRKGSKTTWNKFLNPFAVTKSGASPSPEPESGVQQPRLDWRNFGNSGPKVTYDWSSWK